MPENIMPKKVGIAIKQNYMSYIKHEIAYYLMIFVSSSICRVYESSYNRVHGMIKINHELLSDVF